MCAQRHFAAIVAMGYLIGQFAQVIPVPGGSRHAPATLTALLKELIEPRSGKRAVEGDTPNGKRHSSTSCRTCQDIHGAAGT
jgi:hypothetical protein